LFKGHPLNKYQRITGGVKHVIKICLIGAHKVPLPSLGWLAYGLDCDFV
jgi:hypothetical protein